MAENNAKDLPKKRAANFSLAEQECLVTEVHKVHKELFGKLSNKLTNTHKKAMWTNITSKVNAVSKENRQLRQIQKRWYDLSKDVKKKEAKRRKVFKLTGNIEEPPVLNAMDEKIISIIGEEAISGIDGGFDTAAEEECKNTQEDDKIDKESKDTDPEVEDTELLSNESTLDNIDTQPPMISSDIAVPRSHASSPNISISSNEDTSYTRIRPKQKAYETPTERLARIEEERLEIEKQRLEIEQQRLQVETERLMLEKQRGSGFYSSTPQSQYSLTDELREANIVLNIDQNQNWK